MLYLDSSALVKLFVKEDHTPLVQTTVKDAAATLTRMVTSDIAYVETISAIHRNVNGLEDKNTAIARFLDLWGAFVAVPIDKYLLVRAGVHARTYFLRGADAIHLASAVQERTQKDQFLVFDTELAKAADKEGFRVITT